MTISAFAQQTSSSSAGKVTAVRPSASIFRGSGTKAVRTVAAKDERIQWNDILRTEASGRARIQLEDQSILTLGSNSTLRVVKHDGRSQQTSLELGYGRIRCQIRQITADNGRFELRTPTAVAGVIGTDFGADSSDPDETRFVCVNGAVRVRSSDPNITAYTDCTAGMSVTVRRGEAPRPAIPATQEQIERWQHITEPGDDEFANTIPVPTETPGAALRGRDPFPWLSDTAAGRVRWNNIDFTGSIRFRVEGWDWFDPPAGIANAEDSYAFAHSTLKFALTQDLERWAWGLEITQPTIFGAPEHSAAAAPQGQLGLGATYFLANGNRRTSAYIFPSQLWIKWRGLGGDARNEFTLGRYRFIDGAETKPADAAVAWLKRVRIAHRLLGDFGFSATGRSNDGAMLTWNAGKNNLTVAAARPTAGVFKVNGLGELDAVWAYGAWTRPLANDRAEVRLFGLGYGDGRAIVKTDNRPLIDRSGTDVFQNIAIGTFGGHYLHATPTASGSV
ncbi:MAG: FecR family protein, partial [Terriglobales bacterium]